MLLPNTMPSKQRDSKDVRLAFLFGDQDQTILLDRIALRGYRE